MVAVDAFLWRCRWSPLCRVVPVADDCHALSLVSGLRGTIMGQVVNQWH